MAKTRSEEDVQSQPAAPPAAAREPQPGEAGWADTTPTLTVTCSVEGWLPGCRVFVHKGSHHYSYAEAAALVAAGVGTVTAAERRTLENAGVLKTQGA